MEKPEERFQRILNENNLTANFVQSQVRYLKDGAVLIEKPLLSISFTDPKKEEVASAEIIEPSIEKTDKKTN
jgi:hypothetical protein